MAQTSSSPERAPAPPAASGELVTRPDPGLARGRWEAPVWVFWVILGAVLIGSVVYLLRRLGMLRLPKERAEGVPASSGKARRP